GTVKVPDRSGVERSGLGMHLVWGVEGRLRAGVVCYAALESCLPAGTVSGAPKVRAMEIIEELERSRRGVYAGAVGYIDFSGNLDTCIALRTLVGSGRHPYLHARAPPLPPP